MKRTPNLDGLYGRLATRQPTRALCASVPSRALARWRNEVLMHALEKRVLMSTTILTQPLPDTGTPDMDIYVPVNTPTSTDSDPGQIAFANPKVPVAGNVPVLHSNPNATAKLIIDFDGSAAMTWGSYNVTATPAYDQDGDPTTFNSAELGSINEIWARVAEKYSPFNIDVTTVDSGTYANKGAIKIVVGGSGSWLGATAGGVCFVGSFYNLSVNIGWVFPTNLANGTASYTADAIAHEAGHSFGLQHQSSYSGTTLTAEYNPGNSAKAPIMGVSYYSTRGVWSNGQSDVSSTTLQDDMSIISSTVDGFGYRTDDYGNSVNTATSLTLSNNTLSANGIIEQTTDSDFFSFTIPSSGTLTINLGIAQYAAMLDGTLKIYTSTGTLINTADTSSLGETMTVTLDPGTYAIAVGSHGVYGDVGQYSLSASFSPAAQNPLPPVIVSISDPTGLTVTPISTTQIDLVWSDTSNNETGFLIQRSTDGGSTWTTLTTTASNIVSYHDLTAIAGHTYSYQVEAVNADTTSNFTDPASATTLPAAPATLTAVASSATRITLTWADVTGETGYRIDRSTDGSTWSQLTTTNSDITTYNDDTASPGTKYYYRVVATDSAGPSAASTTANATTLPAAPSSLTATPISATQITLSWTDVTGETSYKIERSPDGSTWTQIATTVTGVITYTDSSATSGSHFYYRVRATNTTGNSSYSPTDDAVTIPAAPTSLTAVATLATRITLTWTDVSGETSYHIDRSSDGVTWTQFADTASGVVTYNDDNIPAGTKYYYRVTAINSTGSSTASTTASALTLPDAPSSLTAVAMSTTQIALTWSDVAGETSFKIERSNNNSTWTQIGTTTSGVLTYTDSTVTGGSHFYYRVRAANVTGNSPYSTTADATTLVSTPTSLTAVATLVNRITLTWTDVAGETGYHIDRSTDGSAWTQLATTDAGVVTYNDDTVPTGTKYYYRVTADGAGGDSAPSNTASATSLPAGPSSLTATAASATQVDLSWSDVTGETSYKIERSTNGTTWAQIATTAADVTTYTDSTATAGTHLFYRVRAGNVTGNSTYSPTADATTLPAAPTSVTAATITITSITVHWTAVTGAAHYELERSTDGTTNWTNIATLTPDVLSFTDTSLTAATPYFYRLRATSTAGQGAYSTTLSTTTSSLPTSVNAPTLLKAVLASSPTRITLTWKDNSTNEDGFVIQRSTDNGSSWTTLATTAANIVTYSDTSISAGQTYSYQVYSTASQLTSSPITISITLLPAAPTNLTVTGSDTSISLSWNNVDGETSFEVERSSTGASWTRIASLTPDTTTYADSGLSAGSKFYYRVRAVNAGGATAYTNTVLGLTTPAAASTPTARVTSSTKITLTWSAAAGAAGYELERSIDGSSNWTKIFSSTNSLTYLDTGLAPGNTFYYRVRAINATGAGAYSPTASCLTTPAAPGAASAANAGTTQINLSWTASTGATSTFIERSVTGLTGWTSIATLSSGTTTYSDTTLVPGLKYFYRLRSSNASGYSEYSTTLTATTTSAPPAAPTTLTSTVLSKTSVQLRWTDNSFNESGFRIEYSSNAGKTWKVAGQTAINATSANVTGLTANTLYTFRVTAYNQMGLSSAIVGTARTLNTTAVHSAPVDADSVLNSKAVKSSIPLFSATFRPDAPTNLVASTFSKTAIQLSWDPSTSDTNLGYKIEYFTAGHGWKLAGTVSAGQTTARIDGLKSKTAYTFRMSSYNLAGLSTPSTSASARTAAPTTRALTASFPTPILNVNKVNIAWAGLPNGFRFA